ncbi:MAG: hypothetical protein ACRCW0_06805 [Clostridium sp.]
MSEIEKLGNKVAEMFIEKQRVSEEVMKLNRKLDELVLKEQLKRLDKDRKNVSVA